ILQKFYAKTMEAIHTLNLKKKTARFYVHFKIRDHKTGLRKQHLVAFHDTTYSTFT
ncbi:unnamed protein product, partial [Rotaria sordida]